MANELIIQNRGYVNVTKVTDTLQGDIWRATINRTKNGKIYSKSVIIKTANKYLHRKSMAITSNKRKILVKENIIRESKILKHLSSFNDKPSSIIKYYEFFKSESDYFLAMEDGGQSLLEFAKKGHEYMINGLIQISEWHKICKIIFKQIIQSVEYLHNKNIAHFDISLENILINDIDVNIVHDTKNHIKAIQFADIDRVEVKLCDFGLSELFDHGSFLCNKYCGKTNYKSPEIANRKKIFNAASNDIWCVGVCLFMLIIGGIPWMNTTNDDKTFFLIMNGKINKLLKKWNKINYVNKDLLYLFSSIFQTEKKRISLKQIKQCKWLNR